MDNIAKALFEIQGLLSGVVKDSKNPHFKNDYTSINALLDAVKPLFHERGILLTQPLSNVDGRPSIKLVLTHIESGEQWESETMLVAKKEDPQAAGSAITYFRRYALKSFLGLKDLDDDGEAAVGRGDISEPPQDTQPKDNLFKSAEYIALKDAYKAKTGITDAAEFKSWATFNCEKDMSKGGNWTPADIKTLMKVLEE